jgi:hypothetical protein
VLVIATPIVPSVDAVPPVTTKDVLGVAEAPFQPQESNKLFWEKKDDNAL